MLYKVFVPLRQVVTLYLKSLFTNKLLGFRIGVQTLTTAKVEIEIKV